jgi:hypothetical protein
MNETIQDGVGNPRISDVVVPVFDGEMAGNQGGAEAMTVFNDLQKVASFGNGSWEF